MSLHFSEEPHRRGLSKTVCGRRVPFEDLAAHAPTCPECSAWLHDDRSVEDVFGTPDDARQFGEPVHTTLGNPLIGYRPKGA